MSPPFKQLNREQFAALIEAFDFKRRIDSIHMHHTWKPNRSQYKGHDTIVAMWRFHTETNHWSDIAQHLTIAPDGSIWLGRNWNLPPASAKGFNGNERLGPFMFEMIGNFDTGHDPFDGEQRKTALEVIARVQRRFNLPPEALRFHNMMSQKTCPGSSIDREEVIAEVRRLHAALRAEGGPRGLEPPPFGPEALESRRELDALIESLTRQVPVRLELADAEPTHEEFAVSRGEAEEARVLGLTAEMLDELRPHLINLNMGEFSSDGEVKTSQEDVDAIFEEHLEKALEAVERRNAADGRRDRLRLLFYAHGGLVKESAGLQIAHKHVQWWKENSTYPIYFVWETGLLETIGQLIRQSQQRVPRMARDMWDWTTDSLIELGVRALQAPRIWGGMKLSAERAVGERGGARYVAARLKEFCDQHPHQVELHAVGHSAGAIFHAHFLAKAREFGVPSFKTAHFLAPAIRVDTFLQQAAGLMGEGRGIDHLSLFTMRKSYEQADHCAFVYRKSLLYLVSHACEPEPGTPILGLEASLRADSRLKQLFGLGIPAASGEVIWSVSDTASERSASTSRSHGGFDDDPPTMNSIARRVLGKADADGVVEYTAARSRAVDLWEDQVDWPERLAISVPAVPMIPLASMAPMVPERATVPAVFPASAAGRRRALCVGINRYRDAPLSGCVADAQSWAQTLRQFGFEQPVFLTDEQATRGAIMDALTALVTSSTAGDMVVFQYSGHGTQLPDVSGDEAEGDTSGLDEAICPIDYPSGAFLIDDDIGEIFNHIPAGVSVTCFMDCCHSGTISRFAVGTTSGARAARADERARFIVATPEMIDAHQAFRRTLVREGRRAMRSPGLSLMKEVVFSACLSSEVAWESGGHGEFTVRATRVLEGGLDGITHEAFEQRVIAEFGPAPRQHARLYCAPTARSTLLLQPQSATDQPAASKASVVEALHGVIRQVQQL